MIEHEVERLKELERLIGVYRETYTAFDTQAKVIEPLFKNCLGWTEADIERETRLSSRFIDYIFNIDGIGKFVLEVKKTGIHFEIPDSFFRRYYKIRGILGTRKPIMSAMEQAQKYCIETGVRYGVVSNGHQFIIFEAFKYGRPWWDSKCIVFRSLEDIRKNFTLFHKILGKEAVKAGSLQEYISEEPRFISHFRVEEIVEDQLRRVPDELKKYLPPILLRPDLKTHVFSTEDYFILVFVDENEHERIKRREKLGLVPFPGLIEPKKEIVSERAMFSIENTKNAMFQGLSVRTPLSFALGKDSTLILYDYKQQVPSKEGYNEFVVELGYIISYGDEVNRYNVYNYLEDLIAYSLKQWKSEHA